MSGNTKNNLLCKQQKSKSDNLSNKNKNQKLHPAKFDTFRNF